MNEFPFPYRDQEQLSLRDHLAMLVWAQYVKGWGAREAPRMAYDAADLFLKECAK